MKLTEPQRRMLAAINADDQLAIFASKQFQRLLRTLRDRGLATWALSNTTQTGYALTDAGKAALE